MARFLKALLTVIIVLLVIGYFASSYLFSYAARKMAPLVLERLADRGVTVDHYDFESIRFTSFNTISAINIAADARLKQGNDDLFKAVFRAERLNIKISQFYKPAIKLDCANFQLFLEKAKEIPGTSFGQFDRGYIKFNEQIYVLDPGSGMARILQDMTGLFRDEETFANAEVRALVTFHVRDKEAQAFLYTVMEHGRPSLRFEQSDIRKLADKFDLELSDQETEIIARYPLRAPLIMRITSNAKETSRMAHRKNPAVPEDAYRHVLWSYLLTQRFGAEFAETITDAHEVLPTNTAAERRMDFHNNRIGREYALRGENQKRIEWLVMNDPQVIKRPKDA